MKLLETIVLAIRAYQLKKNYNMSDEGLKMYLLLLQSKEGDEIKESYIAVKQAQISDSISENAERVGRFGVIFTTKKNWFELNEKLNMKKDEHYLLIELSENFKSDTISGVFPDTNIKELKSLNIKNLKRNAKWLEIELKKAVEREDYEKAAKLKKGSPESNKTKVGNVTWDQVRTIAEDKIKDMNAFKIESAMRMIAGTARSMGIVVKGDFPESN